MSELFNIIGKHVAVLGAGRSGKAAVKLALSNGARVSLWDGRGDEVFEDVAQTVECHPNFSVADAVDFAADLIVLSPGIDTFSELVKTFAAKAPLIGETEFAARFFSGDIIGITGTNGKTTTTELVSLILKEARLGGTPCGNYGKPLSEVVMEPSAPKVVSLELSSFQLETIETLHPKVAIWLNFASDHMDRYSDEASYKRAKLRIFENLGPEDTVVVRDGENLPLLNSKVLTFSTETEDADYFSDGKTIIFQGEVILNLESDTALRGLHNAENVMAAIAACKAYGVNPAAIAPALEGYAPPPHRCELIRTLDGVEYLNDSKATNIHALQCAIRSQSRQVVLIAGGKNKGLDYSPVMSSLEGRVLSAITFGEIGLPLAAKLREVIPTISVSNLSEAVEHARSIAPYGSTILFSPGTSSFDQFKGYEDRGNQFRDIVHQLS